MEDNDINMEVAEFQLTSQGATVDKAWDGREAVERFAASAPGVYQRTPASGNGPAKPQCSRACPGIRWH